MTTDTRRSGIPGAAFTAPSGAELTFRPSLIVVATVPGEEPHVLNPLGPTTPADVVLWLRVHAPELLDVPGVTDHAARHAYAVELVHLALDRRLSSFRGWQGAISYAAPRAVRYADSRRFGADVETALARAETAA